MDKLKFTFQSKPTMDGKSNYIAITSITTQDLKIFVIPEEYQAASIHKLIYLSLINSKLLKIKNKDLNYPNNTSLKTINGVKKGKWYNKT